MALDATGFEEDDGSGIVIAGLKRYLEFASMDKDNAIASGSLRLVEWDIDLL